MNFDVLYHGSSFKHDQLKPGFDHTGIRVEWDKTESNEFLYADENAEEAVSMAFASLLEQKYNLSRYQTKGDTINITVASGERLFGKHDLTKLKVYVYIISKADSDGWVKVNNQHNNSNTEWKTKKHIKQNILGIKEVDVYDWLKRKELKVSNETVDKDDATDEKDVGDAIQRIREFGEKKGLPEETINDFIADELNDQKEKASSESLPVSFRW